MRAGVGEIVQGEGGDLGSSQGLGLGDFSLLRCVCKSQGAWNTRSHEGDQTQARRGPQGGGTDHAGGAVGIMRRLGTALLSRWLCLLVSREEASICVVGSALDGGTLRWWSSFRGLG